MGLPSLHFPFLWDLALQVLTASLLSDSSDMFHLFSAAFLVVLGESVGEQ